MTNKQLLQQVFCLVNKGIQHIAQDAYKKTNKNSKFCL